jgi:trehalose-6-phosphatase
MADNTEPSKERAAGDLLTELMERYNAVYWISAPDCDEEETSVEVQNLTDVEDALMGVYNG